MQREKPSIYSRGQDLMRQAVHLSRVRKLMVKIFAANLVPLILLGASVAAGQLAPPRKDIPAIAKAANGAVVTIVTANNDKPIAQGTGFLASPDGVIVTNYHVIQTGNIAIVKFSDGTTLPVDGVLAADKVRDLAIIKIHGKNFPALTLGNSDRVQIGEEVIAIGNPLGLALGLMGFSGRCLAFPLRGRDLIRESLCSVWTHPD